MTGLHLRNLGTLYKKAFSEMDVSPDSDSTASFTQRACWLVNNIDKPLVCGDVAKAMRWIGFAQGVLVAMGKYSVEEIKTHAIHADRECLPIPAQIPTAQAKVIQPVACAACHGLIEIYGHNTNVPVGVRLDYLKFSTFDPQSRLPKLNIQAGFAVFNSGWDFDDQSLRFLMNPILLDPSCVTQEAVSLLNSMLLNFGFEPIPIPQECESEKALGVNDWQRHIDLALSGETCDENGNNMATVLLAAVGDALQPKSTPKKPVKKARRKKKDDDDCEGKGTKNK